jgi:hypothetical protein
MNKFKKGDIIVRKFYDPGNVPCVVEEVFASNYRLSWKMNTGPTTQVVSAQEIEYLFILEHRAVLPYTRLWVVLNA